MNDGLLTEVRAILDEGHASLQTALARFWPARGNNDIAEANLTMHVMRACANRGMATFGEIPVLCGDVVRGRIDAFAIDDALTIALECKRLYSHEKAQSIASDVARLRTCRVPTEAPLASSTAVVIVAATTCYSSIAQWWQTLEREPGRGAGWAALAAQLPPDPAQRVVLRLPEPADWNLHLLAAFFERAPFDQDG